MCTRRWVMDETPKLIERHPETTILATRISRRAVQRWRNGWHVHALGDGWNTKTNRTPPWNDYFSHRNQLHALSNVGETADMWSTRVNISFLKKIRGWFEKLQGNANTEEERGEKRIISDKLKIFYVHTPLGDGWNIKTNRTPPWNDYFSHRNQSHAPSNVGETTDMWSTHVNISFFKKKL